MTPEYLWLLNHYFNFATKILDNTKAYLLPCYHANQGCRIWSQAFLPEPLSNNTMQNCTFYEAKATKNLQATASTC